MAHFTHRILYTIYRQPGSGGTLAPHANQSVEAFRTTPDAVAGHVFRLTADPNVAEVRVERIKVERNPR